MQVHLSTSSSEDVTDVLCVGLSFFFSLLSCFPSHKPLLKLSAKTVNSFLQQLSWPELLSAFQGWHSGAVGLEHSWQLQLPPCGFSARAWSELRHQRGDVLCSKVRNIYVKCTGKPTVKPTSRCSVGIVWKGMCCPGQRHQELVISGEMGEKEVDWMVQRPAKFQWFLEAPKDFDGVRWWYEFAVFSSLLPMNLYPHTNGMG